MKMQVLSDLHLEHGGILPEHDPDADVIVLAGDLAPVHRPRLALLVHARGRRQGGPRASDTVRTRDAPARRGDDPRLRGP